jgi:hypothetical protein
MTFLAELSDNFMDPGLQAVERSIAAAGVDQDSEESLQVQVGVECTPKVRHKNRENSP